MKILMSGASGLVGAAARRELEAAGHAVVPLVRRPPMVGEIQWNPAADELAAAALAGCDAVVHLAGENIGAQKRWSAEHKQRVRASRVQSTRLLAARLAEARPRPQALICASATGFYGSRGDEHLTENSAPGEGFLAELCRDWEAAAAPAVEAGIRLVHLRFGIVLARQGGALAQMLPLFKWGLGGQLGSGRQYWSWLTDTEAAGMIRFALENDCLRGPVNAVAPEPVTNLEFTRVLAAAVRRPAIVPAPAFLLRALYGEMADELLLASARVEPAALLAATYPFRHPHLAETLTALLR